MDDGNTIYVHRGDDDYHRSHSSTSTFTRRIMGRYILLSKRYDIYSIVSRGAYIDDINLIVIKTGAQPLRPHVNDMSTIGPSYFQLGAVHIND